MKSHIPLYPETVTSSNLWTSPSEHVQKFLQAGLGMKPFKMLFNMEKVKFFKSDV